MTARLIVCGGADPPKRASADVIELDTSPQAPPQKRIFLRLDTLTERLLDNVEPVMADAVEVASYVFIADRLVRRGTEQMARMGAEWRRSLRFVIPVRRPDIWSQPEVLDKLTETLGFLSEDNFAFEFLAGNPAVRLDPFLGYNDPNAQIVSPDDVILFSGGLDSLAGTVERLVGQNRKAVLVTHKSSKNLAKRQDALIPVLTERVTKQRCYYAPVWVTKGDYEPVEYTQRTRSFLFASLGISVASMFQRDTLQIFENGITSFNLPIAEHVIGTRASRTTHPRVLASFSRLFSLLLQRKVKIENPYLWKTKAEVVGVLQSFGCERLIPETTSCAGVRNLAMTTKQCGVCSQCIERRFALLAANLDAEEAPDAYAHELFLGAHKNAEDVTLIEQYVLRAERLASMSQHAFLASYGQVFRALSSLPGKPSTNAAKIYELHQQHGRSVMEIVNRELRNHAGFKQAQTVEPRSLLSLINSPVGTLPSYKDPVEIEPTASQQAAADDAPVKNRRFVFAIDQSARKVKFEDGPELVGKSFQLIERLAEQFRVDLMSGVPAKSATFVRTHVLLKEFGIEEHALGQRVLRMRRSLEKQFIAAIDYKIDRQDVIQSDQWKGYRLNPYLLLVDCQQLQRQDMSGLSVANVMTSSPGR